MSIGQHIFLIFYAVLFGAMLTRLSGLHAFPWGFFYESAYGGFRLLWRLLVSIFCFYLLPVIVFGVGFSFLAGYPGESIPAWHAALIALSALSAFAPYRLFLFLMISLRATPIRLYSRESFEEIIAQRHIRRSPTGHLISLLLFSALILIDYWIVGLAPA